MFWNHEVKSPQAASMVVVFEKWQNVQLLYVINPINSFHFSKNGKPQKRGKINLIGRLQLSTERSGEEEKEGIVQLRILRTQVGLSLVRYPQIYKRDPRPGIPPRVMASSAMGLKLGHLGFCWPHMQNKCIHDLCASCGVSTHVYLHPQTAVYAGDIHTWRNTVIFILIVGKTRIPPIWAPCWDQNGAGSGISLAYLWVG